MHGKMKSITKHFTILLAIFMVVTMVWPGSIESNAEVIADQSWYTGHESDTEYTLTSTAQLEGLAAIVNAGTDNFEGKTITLSDDFDGTEAFTSVIGNDIKAPFKGTFDGNNQTVELDISSSSAYVGMFGCINSASIKNIYLTGSVVVNCTDNVKTSVGTLVGSSSTPVAGKITLENCHSCASLKVEGNVGNTGGLIGGISGIVYPETLCMVKSCSANVNIDITLAKKAPFVGGFVGYASYTNIYECYASGKITMTAADINRCNAAGFAGYAVSLGLYNCYSTGDVKFTLTSGYESKKSTIGGFVSEADDGSTIYNCYSTGNIENNSTYASSYSGSFIGLTDAQIYNSFALGNATCYRSSGTFAGKEGNDGKITSCYAKSGTMVCAYGPTAPVADVSEIDISTMKVGTELLTDKLNAYVNDEANASLELCNWYPGKGKVPMLHYPNDFITFESAGFFKLQTYNLSKNWDGTVYYSTDKATWREWDGKTITAAQTEGAGNYYIYLFGTTANTKICGDAITPSFVYIGTKTYSCSGNIETLRGATANNPSPTQMADYCYQALFKDCDKIISAPSLPATSLSDHCYYNMFSNCTSLKTAPAVLPAKKLPESCYSNMFSSCSSLIETPVIKATIFGDSSCYDMFAYCTSLTTVNAFNVTELVESSCGEMFMNCTSLTTVPILSAPLKEYCYNCMFQGCKRLYITSVDTQEEATWTIAASEAYGTVEDMVVGCYKGSATVSVPSSGTNYYKVVGVFDITNGTKSDDKASNNGYITIDKTEAPTGSTVTVTVTPNEGYELDALKYNDGTSDVTIAKTGDNYTFKMPASAVNVTATFKNKKIALTVKASTFECTYDGNEHTGTWEITSGSLVEGDVFVATLSGSITNVGSDTSTIASYVVMRGEEDVTAEYDITTENGTITINPVSIKFKSGDAEKYYDSTPLTCSDINIVSGGFVGEENFDFTNTGSQTEVGFSENTFTYLAKDGTSADNYSVSVEYGTLTVKPDTTAPEISEISDGTSYYTTQKFIVTDSESGVKSVKINEATVSEYVLSGNQDIVYTIVATDYSGNETAFNVIMKPISSLAEDIADITTSNVTSDNRTDIDTVKNLANDVDTTDATQTEIDALNGIKNNCDDLLQVISNTEQAIRDAKNASENYAINTIVLSDKADISNAINDAKAISSGNLTATEKTALDSYISTLSSFKDSIDKVENVISMIDELPAVENIQVTDEKAVNDADDAYTNLSEYEKSLIGKELTDKLNDAVALVSPPSGDSSNVASIIAFIAICSLVVCSFAAIEIKRRKMVR